MSLQLPDADPSIGTFCGIDPGSQHLGLCALTLCWDDLSIIGIEAQTLHAPLHTGLLEPNDPLNRDGRIRYTCGQLMRLFEQYRPWLVCCESPFYNRFRPSAYAALVDCVCHIRQTVHDYDPSLRYLTYEPAVIKKAVGAKGHGTKQVVKDCLSAIDEVASQFDATVWASLDEHSIDAIAVAYTHVFMMRRHRLT